VAGAGDIRADHVPLEPRQRSSIGGLVGRSNFRTSYHCSNVNGHAFGDEPIRANELCSTARLRDLKTRDRAAGIALYFFDAFAARCRSGVVAPARRTFDELETPVRLGPTAARGATVGMLPAEIGPADADLMAANADERPSASRTTGLNNCTFGAHDYLPCRVAGAKAPWRDRWDGAETG